METTLNGIEWAKLLTYLDTDKPDDGDDLAIDNGFTDALWCLREIEGFDREKGLFAVWCARQVKHPVIGFSDLARVEKDFAEGKELNVAWVAARASGAAARVAEDAVAEDAAEAARVAARVATRRKQEKEFRRMLVCIKQGTVYEI